MTDAEPFPRVTTSPVGGPGTVVAGTKLFDAADAVLAPIPFVAVAVHVYVLPFVSPVTTIGLAGPDVDPVAPPSDDRHVIK